MNQGKEYLADFSPAKILRRFRPASVPWRDVWQRKPGLFRLFQSAANDFGLGNIPARGQPREAMGSRVVENRFTFTHSPALMVVVGQQ